VTSSRLTSFSLAQPIGDLLPEHGRPQLDKLGLIEVAVLVLIEHLYQVVRHLLVEAHLLLDDGDHLVWTEHSVTVLVQLVETRRYIFIAVPYTRTHARTAWSCCVR